MIAPAAKTYSLRLRFINKTCEIEYITTRMGLLTRSRGERRDRSTNAKLDDLFTSKISTSVIIAE